MTCWLEESSESGSTNPPTKWASHRSGIGYRRTVIQSDGGSSGSGGGGGGGSGGATTIAGKLPLIDSGTATVHALRLADQRARSAGP